MNLSLVESIYGRSSIKSAHLDLINQKQEWPVAAMFVHELGRIEQSL
jgi:hypothetical protein